MAGPMWARNDQLGISGSVVADVSFIPQGCFCVEEKHKERSSQAQGRLQRWKGVSRQEERLQALQSRRALGF